MVQKTNLKNMKRVSNNHGDCYVEMPNEDNKTLKCNHGEKSVKVSFIVCADLFT